MGRRAGAVTVSIDSWHLDLPEFLEIQTEAGDTRRKAYDCFPQLVVSNEFMRRVVNDQQWTLIDPYEVKKELGYELTELWGEKFEAAYAHIESEVGNKLKLYKVVNAKEVFKDFMRTAIETGMPYLIFKDTINEANPNKDDGTIYCTNLCVAPETQLLTDKGHITIGTLEGQKVTIWNGFEWSDVLVRKTGTNQKLIKVEFSNGESLDCTPAHHFWIQRGYKSKPVRKEAKDLAIGDKLIKFNLPAIESEDDEEFPYAYTHGFFSGDGSYYDNGKPEINLYGKKKELLPYITTRNKMRGNSSHSYELKEVAVYDDIKQDRLVCKLPLDLPAKFTVPLSGYTIQSRLEWLAGLMDSDGTIAKNGDNESIQIGSVNKTFLLEIRLMLQTLGVDSKVTVCREEGFYALPDGKGGLKDYQCQTVYRLLINSIGLFQLSELGLKTNRLQWSMRKPQRSASQFVQVTNVDLELNRYDDTYCFTEPKRHYGIFNGILTGQCIESYSNIKPGKYIHCCNLTSLNLATIPDDKLEDVCTTAVRLLDATIEITEPPVPEAAAHNERYRTIGVGSMGLADWLALRGLSFKSKEQISDLFERIAYYCTKASMELAKELGDSFEAYPYSEWAKGKLVNSYDKDWFAANARAISVEDWHKLSDDVMNYGIRNSQITAIAPNTSSSLLQGCTASVLPAFGRFVTEKWGRGVLHVVPTFIKDKMWFYEENRRLDQRVVVESTAEIQKWIKYYGPLV